MEVISLGIEAVWSAQRYSRELADSVWSVRFYKHLLDVLENDTWRNYPSEAFGRPCQFDKLTDFLTHPDGLGWPAVRQVLDMIEIVSKCNPPPPPRKNEPADPPITQWAAKAKTSLEACGLTASSAHADATLADDRGFNPDHRPPADPDGKGDVVTLNETGKGNSAAYLAARLKKAGRDDLLEQIGPGKQFSSMRSAAIEAGIIRPVPTVRLVDDPSKVAAAIRRHLSDEQISQLVAALASSPSQS